MPKLTIGEYQEPRTNERTFSKRGGFSGMGSTRVRVSETSNAFAANNRTTLYVVAVQVLTRSICEYIRLRGTGRDNDAIQAAKAKHGRHYPARIVSIRVMD